MIHSENPSLRAGEERVSNVNGAKSEKKDLSNR